MCHKTAERCEFKWPASGCDGKRYFFCCYDQPFTKMLMVQVKAQLGEPHGDRNRQRRKESHIQQLPLCGLYGQARGEVIHYVGSADLA